MQNMDLIFNQLPLPVCFFDSNCRIVTFNDSFANYYEIKLEDVKGKLATYIDPNARFPIILKTCKAELGQKHTFKGKEIIVDRIPLFFNNQLIGGISITIIDDFNFLYKLITENNLIRNFKLYKSKNDDISKVYKAKYTWKDILSTSSCLNNCKEQGKIFADTDFPVLITGESGVGKELFAHSIHNHSKRKDNPFITVNCAAIPENLIESELFGHEEGSFTGASKNGRIGKFELANTGTIFLDEIGDLPLKMQAKLLRVLQEKEVERVGSNKVINLDVRVLAATNCNIQNKVNEGTFRADLFYRLNVLPLEIPPLRERTSDIPILIKDIVNKFYEKYRIYHKFPDAVIDALCLYGWPGNARQLKNIIERMMVLCKDDIIKMENIPKNIFNKDTVVMKDTSNSLKSSVSETEKKIILDMLAKNNYNKSKTAKALGIQRMTLYRKLKQIMKPSL